MAGLVSTGIAGFITSAKFTGKKILNAAEQTVSEVVSTFVSGVSGWIIKVNGDAEFKSIYARDKIVTNEYVYNRIRVTEDEEVVTSNGKILSSSDNEDGTFTIYLDLREGDINPFADGDLLQGYYHNPENSGVIYAVQKMTVQADPNKTDQSMIVICEDGSQPYQHMIIVRVGNLFDTDRQSFIKISSRTNCQYFHDGINSFAALDNPENIKCAIGKLDIGLIPAWAAEVIGNVRKWFGLVADGAIFRGSFILQSTGNSVEDEITTSIEASEKGIKLDIKDGLERTGIDITNHNISLQADRTTFKNSKGNTLALLDDDFRLSGDVKLAWGNLSDEAKENLKGEDGKDGVNGTNGTNGANGVNGEDGTSIVWKGNFASHPSNPKDGWAYKNTTDKKSYVYQSGAWYQMTIDGVDGVNGKDGNDGLSVVWKGEMSNPPANPQKNWVYRDTDNGYVYIYNGSSWTLMVADGNNGADGTPGSNGMSVYITYHDSISQPSTPTGNGTTNGWHTNATASVVWMSQKIAASATTGSWGNPIKIKGNDGANGTNGKDANLLPWIEDWNNNKTQIGSEYFVSPKMFSGTNTGTATNPILTGIAQGRDCITIDGIKRTGIFALVDNEVVFELDPITKKYLFKGEIQSDTGTFNGMVKSKSVESQLVLDPEDRSFKIFDGNGNISTEIKSYSGADISFGVIKSWGRLYNNGYRASVEMGDGVISTDNNNPSLPYTTTVFPNGVRINNTTGCYLDIFNTYSRDGSNKAIIEIVSKSWPTSPDQVLPGGIYVENGFLKVKP